MSDSLSFKMLRIRMIEEEIARRYPEGKMRCPVHLSIGQEAAAVGICAGLEKEDKMVSTHRGHAHYLAKGGSLKGLIGELYGKSSGCSKGNGGSMHLIDLSVNFFGSTSIVGGTIPVGVGLAFADRFKGSTAKTVICIGDAAIEEGVFHEAANFAGLHRLNVVFAVEHNQYSCYTHISKRQPKRLSFGDLARSHGLSFFQATEPIESIEYRMKSALNAGPSLIEIPTWRHLEHCGPNNDDHLGYRPQREYDPIPHIDDGSIRAEIDEAFQDAESAPFPDESEVGRYVYANS
jgi:TPP-dependent pyruvate/acetoin dehydrogenase alpha subunit